MGYFNYFIKCIIRNIAYKLCKPKVFFTVLLSVLIILLLHNTGYCTDSAWTEADVDFVNNMLNSIANSTNYLYSINSSLANGTNVKLEEIKTKLDTNNANLTEIKQELVELNESVNNILKQLTGGSSSFSYRHSALSYAEIIPPFDNLEQSGYFTIVQDSGTLNIGYKKIDYLFKAGTTYTFAFNKTGANEISTYIYYTTDEVVSGKNFYANYLGKFTGSNANFSITPEKDTYITLLTNEAGAVSGSNGTWTITGVSKGLINELQGTMDKNNQLQEESNKLQQEQNDILTNDDVETDGLEFATDDTENPTSAGFDTLFTTIYNSFCNMSSAPLTVTLPFVNQTFTVSPNLVSNAMQKCGLGFVATLIHSFYYFSVCLFIYKDINKIIEHLKSGNLTADCGNVKTEVL